MDKQNNEVIMLQSSNFPANFDLHGDPDRHRNIPYKRQEFRTSINKCGVDIMKLTLETFHHAEAAEKVVEGDIYPPLRVAHYWRPGAPKAGLMMYAKIGGEWEKVGWIREKNRQAVLEMAGGDGVEALTVTLLEKYIKRGYCVLKVEVL
ncbi:uncharacterized protein LOC144869605 [Branchiostoma floridae x Branchiostoma japonicum]